MENMIKIGIASICFHDLNNPNTFSLKVDWLENRVSQNVTHQRQIDLFIFLLGLFRDGERWSLTTYYKISCITKHLYAFTIENDIFHPDIIKIHLYSSPDEEEAEPPSQPLPHL